MFLTIALMALMQHIELDRDAARESEEQYRLLADNVYDFIWTTDIELTYVYTSPSCEKLFRYTPKELIGQPFLSTTHPDSVDVVLKTLEEELQHDDDHPDPGEFVR